MYDPLFWCFLNLDLAHMFFIFLWMIWESCYLTNLTCWENGKWNFNLFIFLYTCIEPCELVIVLSRMLPRKIGGYLEMLFYLMCSFQDPIEHNEVLHICGKFCGLKFHINPIIKHCFCIPNLGFYKTIFNSSPKRNTLNNPFYVSSQCTLHPKAYHQTNFS
jgi:hypothetical protein